MTPIAFASGTKRAEDRDRLLVVSQMVRGRFQSAVGEVCIPVLGDIPDA
jgi:hypothetical protein